jgi:hypothetical protein
MLKGESATAEQVGSVTVVQFLKGTEKQSAREKKLDPHNSVRVVELNDNKFQCTTCYDGQMVHWQILKKNGVGSESQGFLGGIPRAGLPGGPVGGRASILGNRW